jgi:DNA-binding transcriptional ArsR family regulator
VRVRREGRSSWYRLDREHLEGVAGGWLRHLEPVGPERKWKSSGPKTTRELKGAKR